jgi:hypothetical protein
MDKSENEEPPFAKVMLFGTFHFQNPSLDAVKNRVHDVTQQESQAYLINLSKRISEFKPTTVLLEFDPKEDDQINSRYQSYLKNSEYNLSVNEIEQLGFRIAKQSDLQRVDSFDNRDTPWKSKDLFEKLNDYPDIKSNFEQAIHQLTKCEDELHASKALNEILAHYNSPEIDQKNKSLYLLTNQIGAGDDFSGANAAASWWHRNFKMFAMVQKFAKPRERVLVIGGQGHIAVIRDLVPLDPGIVTEDITDYL